MRVTDTLVQFAVREGVLDAVPIGFFDAFNESDHPREGGKFTAKGVTGKSVQVSSEKHKTGNTHTVAAAGGKYKQVEGERHEIHHEGKHLGSVETSVRYDRVKHGGRSLTGKARLSWSAHPKPREGESHVRGSYEHRSKADATEVLLRHHGIG